jgi:hypothetical protein
VEHELDLHSNSISIQQLDNDLITLRFNRIESNLIFENEMQTGGKNIKFFS